MFKRFSGVTGCILFATALLFHTIPMSSFSSEVLFFDGFGDSNLPGWNVADTHPPGDVKVRGGKLLMGNNAGLKIDVRGCHTWLDYTTALRLRFLESEPASTFAIFVRSSRGPFNYWTQHQITLSPHEGNITAYTFNPRKQPHNEEDLLQAITEHAASGYNFDLKEWYLVAVETIDHRVVVVVNGKEVLAFEDNAPLTGTVSLSTPHESLGKIRVDFDFISVEGDNPLSVKSRQSYAATWGAIKNTEIKSH